jgi:hypothetical protein
MADDADRTGDAATWPGRRPCGLFIAFCLAGVVAVLAATGDRHAAAASSSAPTKVYGIERVFLTDTRARSILVFRRVGAELVPQHYALPYDHDPIRFVTDVPPDQSMRLDVVDPTGSGESLDASALTVHLHDAGDLGGARTGGKHPEALKALP